MQVQVPAASLAEFETVESDPRLAVLHRSGLDAFAHALQAKEICFPWNEPLRWVWIDRDGVVNEFSLYAWKSGPNVPRRWTMFVNTRPEDGQESMGTLHWQIVLSVRESELLEFCSWMGRVAFLRGVDDALPEPPGILEGGQLETLLLNGPRRELRTV